MPPLCALYSGKLIAEQIQGLKSWHSLGMCILHELFSLPKDSPTYQTHTLTVISYKSIGAIYFQTVKPNFTNPQLVDLLCQHAQEGSGLPISSVCYQCALYSCFSAAKTGGMCVPPARYLGRNGLHHIHANRDYIILMPQWSPNWLLFKLVHLSHFLSFISFWQSIFVWEAWYMHLYMFTEFIPIICSTTWYFWYNSIHNLDELHGKQHSTGRDTFQWKVKTSLDNIS